MKKNIKDMINQQINKELYSAYLYLDISNFYIQKSLDGFGNWFKIQAQEELDHAMLFQTYLQNNGEDVVLDTIQKPDIEFTDFRTPLVEVLAHEKYITASIEDIYTAASEQKDYRTLQVLNWFIEEQGEEEKNAEDLVSRYDLFGTDSKGLYMFDKDLAARVYAPPSLVLS